MAKTDVKVAAGELMGAAETAEFLEISLSALWERRRRKVYRPEFPEPFVVLRCGPIWRRRDVEEYSQRKPGLVTPGPPRRRKRIELDLTPRTVKAPPNSPQTGR